MTLPYIIAMRFLHSHWQGIFIRSEIWKYKLKEKYENVEPSSLAQFLEEKKN